MTAEDELARKAEIEADIEVAKERRSQRESECGDWEVAHTTRARDREQAEKADWHTSEQTFIAEQHLLRQEIRLRDGKPTDADQLASNMRDDFEVAPDTRTPAEYIDERERGGLSAAGAQMPLEAVATELDCLSEFSAVADGAVFKHKAKRRCWECVDAFLKVRIRAMLDNMHVQGAPGLHACVLRDVDKLLAGRARAALERLEQDVALRLKGGAAPADVGLNPRYGEVDFWAAALLEIRARLSRATLRELTDAFAIERARLRAEAPHPARERLTPRADGDHDNADESAFAVESDVSDASRGRAVKLGS
eukprot:IDg3494t1